MNNFMQSSIIFSGMLEMNKNLRMGTSDPSSYWVLNGEGQEGLMRLGASARDLGLITIQITEFYGLVASHGEDGAKQFVERVLDTASQALPRFFFDSQVLATEKAGVGDFMLLVDLADLDDPELMEAYLNFRLRMQEKTLALLREFSGGQQMILIGFARVPKDSGEQGEDGHGLDRRLFKAFCEAQRVARQKPDPGRVRLHREFLDILRERRLHMLYQPVMHFSSGRVLGWEAFTRGPQGSTFHDPVSLFAFATELGELYKLERLCREQSIQQVGDLGKEQLLFLNVQSASLNDPAFSPSSLEELVLQQGMRPENVVFEFTERQTQSELAMLLRRLEHYRQSGFKVAVDDVGAGNSSLRSLSQIRPDFIKSDISLTGGIGSNPFKRVMVETLVLLSEKIGSLVIAEGVETEAEFHSLVSMGVQAGQGYHFARAAFPKPSPEIGIPSPASFESAAKEEWKCSNPVRDLVEPAATVPPTQLVQDTKKMMEDETPRGSVVVVKDDAPVGLLMSYNLDRHLGTQYGISLYYRRPVERLMDKAPLIVDAQHAVEDVAKMAMTRDSQKIYDDIVVVNSGRFMGTVSVQKILDTLAQVQVELAKGSDPLTGLPGNVTIEQEMNTRSREHRPYSLIYFDLDNFKVYNDVYGFNNGDRAIVLIARVLKDTVRKVGHEGDFLGHVGGDDFVIICEPNSAEAICANVSEVFAKEVLGLYNAKDQENGYVVAMGRDGKMARFPLITVSMGIIDCHFQNPFTLDEMSQRGAEVKKYAKTKDGNSWVRDRRAPLGAEAASPE